ncbi:MAG: hypothetical protein N2Z23_02185 [Pyrinomonadaceae bacterium]|nr:hypothetical protein [Pyrinomonadaceae bacterium]MCX7639239.1 hypothetical protein [Pyrinomonadaceae bacterium]MDW8303539.1 hypothetical protein [Acidobacteriota bacterium]
MDSSQIIHSNFQSCKEKILQIYESCRQKKPQYNVTYQQFEERIQKSIYKYFKEKSLSLAELNQLLEELHSEDLYLSIACANGDEQAWWDFDKEYRSYLEKIALKLTKNQTDAEEVVENLYAELYGTTLKEGQRVSKFLTYSGRGSLRGWLKVIIQNSLVDLHRAFENISSVDEIIEKIGESATNFLICGNQEKELEDETLKKLEYKKYLKMVFQALEKAFLSLSNEEKLLLCYYYKENLKLREIAKLAESPVSPLKRLFQRHNKKAGRIHESTIMRWLEKTYKKVHKNFRNELKALNLKPKEIEVCLRVITEDFKRFSLENLLSF